MSTVYNGIPTQEGGGDLFQGLKFWILASVPQRKRWVDAIKSNGGHVVKLEADADIIIADHARLKQAPAGSLSWQFIHESLENGKLEEAEHHRIGRNPAVARPPGSSEAPKKTRTKFTPEDDNIIRDLIQRMGGPHSPNLGGNVIWQELGRQHTNHPWQSWRDRWLKVVSMQGATPVSIAQSKPQPPSESTNGSPRMARVVQASKRQDLTAEVPQPLAVQQDTQLATDGREVATARRQTRSPLDSNTSASVASHSAANDSRTTASPSFTEDGLLGPLTAMDEMDRPEFESHLREFAEVTNQYIDWDLEVEGIALDLYDLMKAVIQQRVPLGEIDWRLVADTLNFNSLALPGVPERLEACFEENLAEFVCAFSECEAEATGQGDAVEESKSLDRAAEQQLATGTLSPEGVESPVLNTSPKRKRDILDIPPVFDFDARLKRPRRNRGDEIPSTPDQEVSLSNPSSFRPKVVLIDRKPQPSPSNRPKSTIVEPETQDMAFQETQRPTLQARESSLYDISPSQQLNTEANLQPIRFSIKSKRKSNSQETPLASPRPSVTKDKRKATSPKRDIAPPNVSAKDPVAIDKQSAVAPTRRLPSTFGKQPTQTAAAQHQVEKASPQARTASQAQILQDTEDDMTKNNRDIEECIARFEAFYAPDIVRTALECTTLSPGLAGQVMQSLSENKGIPKNLQGVWTKEDDDRLRFVDSIDFEKKPKTHADKHLRNAADTDMKKLMRKHGLELIEDRRRFLADVDKLMDSNL